MQISAVLSCRAKLNRVKPGERVNEKKKRASHERGSLQNSGGFGLFDRPHQQEVQRFS